MSDYSKGRIYKVLNTVTDDVYVGSTCSPLTKRFYEHKKTIGKRNYEHNKFYCKMQELGFDNFYIELVENYPCSTREELRAREGEWIRKISTLNKLIAGRDSKGYYDDNAENLRKKARTYRIQNPDKIKAQHKAYYDVNAENIKGRRRQCHAENKDKEREYKQQEWECECGLRVMLRSKCDHLRSKQHVALMNEKGIPTCEIEKPGLTCRCGVTIKDKTNMARHLKTKRHEELMTQQENPQE